MKKVLLIGLLTVSVTALSLGVVYAQDIKGMGNPPGNTNGGGGAGTLGTSDNAVFPNGISDVKGKFCDIFYWIFTGAIIISIIMTTVVAIKYITGGWSITKGTGADKVTAMRKDLWYVVIGLIIAFLAKVVPLIVSSFLGGGALTSC